MAENKQITIEQRFLRDFIQKLIFARAVLKDVENEVQIEAGLIPRIPIPKIPEKRMDKDAIRRYLQSRNPQMLMQPNVQVLRKNPAPVQNNVRTIEVKPNIVSNKVVEQPKIPGTEKLSSYEKVMLFMKDPTIISVESPGPEKPLLVNRSGAIQTTNMILTKEDIDEIVKEVSKKTKIPLLRGVFKAAFGEYLITAVISEYVGTRFTIEKKPVFNK